MSVVACGGTLLISAGDYAGGGTFTTAMQRDGARNHRSGIRGRCDHRPDKLAALKTIVLRQIAYLNARYKRNCVRSLSISLRSNSRPPALLWNRVKPHEVPLLQYCT